MKSKGGARNKPAPAPAPAPAANPPQPTSPTGGKGGAKYRNRDGSKFITLPDSTSAPSSAQPSPTIPGIATAKRQTTVPPVAPDDGSVPAVNRKKQKRREKAAAKAAAAGSVNGNANHASSAGHDPNQDLDDSDEDEGLDDRRHQFPQLLLTNGYAPEHHGKSKKSKKKKKKGGARSVDDQEQPAALTHQPTQGSGISRDRIWKTDSQEERERIKEFWLGLGEDERKSLVKVEKDAVLQKMKEQQKHTCSCSVCGRKRNAIEEELEGLYDAYYEELEQFANHGQQDGHPSINSSPHFGFPHSSRFSNYTGHGHQPSRGRIVPENVGDDEEAMDEPYSDGELDEELDGELNGELEGELDEELDDEPYSDDEPEHLQERPRDYASEFFNFGSSLTVQGGILTVADDLLKNDGKKFIEMMEQLAERRMAREGDMIQDPYARTYGHGTNGSLSGHDHPPPPPVGNEDYEDDEDEEYDDSADDDDYEEDEDDQSMTDEQRMEEGRRMFQIFAARMFEQRVLHAYREKVAKERQLQLVEEEEEEQRKKEAQKEKKAKEAQRKKEKAAQKKAAMAEEKARKDAEKAAEEEARRQAEAEKAEEARQKAEEKRKKRDAQKKAEDDERAKKEAERQRHKQLQLDREREAKEREKRAREEKLQREKEAREQKEREASELKDKQEAERRQRENKSARAETKPSQKQKPSEERATKKAAVPAAVPAAATPASKPLAMRSAQPGTNPALPILPQQPTATNFASPKPSVATVATPALPKALAPTRPRQAPQQDGSSSAHSSSSAYTPSVYTTSASETTSLSYSTAGSTTAGSTPLPDSPGDYAPVSHRGSIASHHSANVSQTMSPLQPNTARFPPATQPSQLKIPFGGMNYPPVPHHAAPPGLGTPLYPLAFRPGSLAMVPPGLSSPTLSRGFPVPVAPPGFAQLLPDPIGPFGSRGSHDAAPSSHSRHPSGGFDSPMLHPAQPIVRPTPIGRPASVVHGQRPPIAIPSAGASKSGDDMENHLGSKALLDDSDDVVPTLPEFGSLPRRGYVAPGRQQGFPSHAFGDPGMLQHSQSQPLWGTSPIQPSVLNSFMQSPPPPPGFGGPVNWPLGSPAPVFSLLTNRPVPSRQPVSVVRQKLACICRDMAMQDPSGEGLISLPVVIDTLNDAVDFNPFGNGPLTEYELLILCETEGTTANGGGNFAIIETASGRSIRWNEHKVHQPIGAFGAPGQFGSPNSSFGR